MTPNTVHFIYPVTHKTRPFSLLNALAIRMAAAVQKPDRILFWTNAAPESIAYWDDIKDLVTLMPTGIPSRLKGVEIKWPQYASDVMRLQILIAHGGIYMDTDLLLLRPLREGHELTNRLVASYENPKQTSICNALMMSPPNSRFLREWLDAMPGFLSAETWAFGGVIAPYVLSQRPDLENEIEIRPHSFCCPLDLSLPWILQDNLAPLVETMVEPSHGIHVFETFWRDSLKDVDRDYVKRRDNVLARLARKYMEI